MILVPVLAENLGRLESEFVSCEMLGMDLGWNLFPVKCWCEFGLEFAFCEMLGVYLVSGDWELLDDGASPSSCLRRPQGCWWDPGACWVTQGLQNALRWPAR